MPINTILLISRLLIFSKRQKQPRQKKKLRRSKMKPLQTSLRELIGEMRKKLILIWEMIQL